MLLRVILDRSMTRAACPLLLRSLRDARIAIASAYHRDKPKKLAYRLSRSFTNGGKSPKAPELIERWVAFDARCGSFW
jgi:hypothetical protein